MTSTVMSSKKRKSKSLEEISNISSSVTDLERAHAARLSVQLPQNQRQQNFRQTKSQNYGRTKKLPPTIAEGDSNDDDDGPVKLKIIDENGEIVDNRSSQRSKVSGRSRSGSNTSKKKQGTSFVNQAFDTSMDGISIKSNRSEERDQNLTISGRSSSIQSLEVQREQYCCFSKWSPCERKLAAVVAILATVIIILVIVVAILAGNERVVPERISMAL